MPDSIGEPVLHHLQLHYAHGGDTYVAQVSIGSRTISARRQGTSESYTVALPAHQAVTDIASADHHARQVVQRLVDSLTPEGQ